MRTLRIAALLAAAALLLYASRLAHAPVYLCDAEVLFALNAQAIASTAHDVNGRFLPLYFQVYGDMWFQPMLVYVTALFLKVLPVSEWAIRLPSAAVGAVDAVLMYSIAKRLFARERWAIAASVLLILTPSHFIHSRLAMDYLYPVPFVMAWLLCLLMFLERRRPWMLFAATSVLGIGVYSYIASVLMMPVYLALTWLALVRTRETRRRLSLVAAAGFIWPLLILIPWLFYHADAIAATAGRYELSNLSHFPRATVAAPAAVASSGGGPAAAAATSLAAGLHQLRQAARFSGVTGRVSLYWYFFDPSYLYLMGGYANVVNSTRRVGVFLLPFLLFVPVGIWRLATGERTRTDLVLLLGFATAPLAACLVVPEPYAIDRELELLPFAVLIATYGLQQLLAAERARWRVVGACALALVPLHFGFFYVDYFTDYRVSSAVWFGGNRRGALEEILAREPRHDTSAVYLSTNLQYIDAYWRFYLLKHDRLDLLPRTVYFDSQSLDVRAVPARSLLLTARKDPAAEALVSAGQLHELAMIPEPGDPALFAILQR